MDPRFYLDVRSHPAGEDRWRTPRPYPVAWVEKTMDALHGVFSNRPGRYAVALPEYRAGDFKRLGRTIRVFAAEREDLVLLRDGLESQEQLWLDEYVQFSSIAAVPDNHPGPWVGYARVRAPRRGKLQPAAFIERLTQVKALPSFLVSSRSTGQMFPLAIGRTQSLSRGGALSKPDGYGLGRPGAPVLLPDLG